MLEKPNLQDAEISACLQAEYGLRAARVVFLPLGADVNTAAYRAVAGDGTPYFVKLRRGVFDETAVTVPKFLSEQGLASIIAPLTTRSGQLWAGLGAFKLILYPFVEGRDAYAIVLSDRQWAEFGAALKTIHTTIVPPQLKRQIQIESYTPQWRESVKAFLVRVDHDTFAEPVAAQVAALLQARRAEILALVGEAERLALALQARAPQFVLCHSDIHAANLLIAANGALYIVDWDNPILAPKERDLMFIGGAQGFAGHTAHEEEVLFYQGYGRQTQIDPFALAYYRYERIVQDVAAYCEQLLSSSEGGDDRERSLRYLASNFLPDGTIEIAYRSDQSLRAR